MKYTEILFDADNTLFDFTEASHLAFQDLLGHYKVKSDQDLYQVYKPFNATAWEKLERNEIDMDGVRQLRWKLFWGAIGLDHDYWESNKIYLDRLVKHTFILKDTIEVLEDINNSDASMHIITNGMKEAQRPRIKRLDLDKYFDTITVSDEIGFAKPDTRFFDHVFAGIPETDRSKYLVVGDSLGSDIQGGTNYQIDTCWFNPGSKPVNPDIKPTYKIQSFKELLKIVY